MDTTDSMVPGWPPPPARAAEPSRGEPPDGRRRPRYRVLNVTLACISAFVVVVGTVSGLVRIPYDTLSPGSPKIVNRIVSVNGHDSFPPAGQVVETTVSVRDRVSILQAFLGWLDPTTDVIAEKQIRGNVSAQQYQQLNVQAMTDSKTSAEVVALEHLGYTNLAVGATVVLVAAQSPASGVLQANDVIVGVDSTAIHSADDASAAIRNHKPGDTIQIHIQRDGAPSTLQATLTNAPDGTARLGIQLTTKYQLPFTVNIDSGQVVGPSAGLAYAIELVDLLTPGELTGGAKVAATGELSPDGTVSAIGGIAQKVITVKRAGATEFIVPKDNEAEAKKHAGHLKIVGVSTFDQALAALGALPKSNALAYAKTAANS